MEKQLRNVAIFSIVAGTIHFIGETWWHIVFGQFLPMLIVDYIAISLLLGAGAIYLVQGRAFGLLCGAWGFECCLAYRALFSRVEVLLHGEATTAVTIEIQILGGMLLVSAMMLLLSMILHYRSDTASQARA